MRYGYVKDGKIIALQSEASYARTDESVKSLWVVVPDGLEIPMTDGVAFFPEADPAWVNPDADTLPPFPPPEADPSPEA